MPASERIQARLIGALFVDRGLVSESQIRVALEIQRETGQQLGQVLVERFGVSRRELASVVADQWAKLGGSSGPEDSASWRRLGEIFVERGFVSQEELEQALTRQHQTGERLGEALVAQGVISKFELAGALAEQMAALEDPTNADAPAEREATVHHFPSPTSDPAEIPFGSVIEEDPTGGPDRDTADGARFEESEVAGAAGEPEPEEVAAEVLDAPVAPEDVGEVLEAEAPGVTAEVVVDDDATAHAESIAIDDVGHVSLVAAAAEAVGPEPSEAGPTALFDDLRGAILADTLSADEPQPEALPSVACLGFTPTTDGYRLVVLVRVPEPGETIDVPDIGERLVLRVGRSPIPGDGRPCAYVEEPVAPAPVAAAGAPT
ncbi:MAG: hypothetical protein M5U27_14265 [Gaiella sp.]|nr:hypothetical protein [Gaiella sp.]